jgi:hypothetical protein
VERAIAENQKELKDATLSGKDPGPFLARIGELNSKKNEIKKISLPKLGSTGR